MISAAGGVCLATASWLPETWPGLAAAVLAALLFHLSAARSRHPATVMFGGGFVFTALAFYWLPATITFFGGFPTVAAWLLFMLFCALSSLQFALCGMLFRLLSESAVGRLLLAFPVAWLAAELIVPRMFPWAIGHALIVWTDVAALAEIVGVPLLSALLCWWAVLFQQVCGTGSRQRLKAAAVFALALALPAACGYLLNSRTAQKMSDAPAITAALIQGNLDAKQKGDLKYFDVNMQRYRDLSAKAAAGGAEMIFWPESVSNYWTPEETLSVRNTELDPMPGNRLPLLYGGLSYRARPPEEVKRILEENPSLREPRLAKQLRHHRFNSAFGIDGDGNVLGRYHKRVLMPFGEYIPLSDRFPWLKSVSPQTGDFSVGDLSLPVTFPSVGKQDAEVRASVLICYEDLIPELSAEAVKSGANLLVNLTNDAWYGDTSAPHQHHLLAQWRAIETRRYLLRVTNTGLTATVDPYGRTVEKLPVFTSGYLLSRVSLLEGTTLYSIAGDRPAWLAVLAAIALALVQRRRRK